MTSLDSPDEKVEVVDRKVVFQGYQRVSEYLFRYTLFQGGQSAVVSREVLEHPNTASVLPYDPQRGEVVLVRRFRIGAHIAGRHPWTWQIVTGTMNGGEAPESLLRREAGAKAKLDIDALIRMHTIMMSPGASSEVSVVYLGRTDTKDVGGLLDLEGASRDILVVKMPLAHALKLLDQGEIDDAVTVLALQWLTLHHDDVRNRWRKDSVV